MTLSAIGHTPRSYVKIGGHFVMCESYDLIINNKNESSTCNINIPLENIEGNVFADESTLNNIYTVQIYSGYVKDTKDISKVLSDIKKDLSNNKIPETFSKRFSGYVLQPEWEFGKERMLKLSCSDVTGILKEIKFIGKVEDNATEIRSLVKAVQKQISGVTIKVQEYSGNIKMGVTDQQEHKQTYSCDGKSLYDILNECATKLGYRIAVNETTVTLEKHITEPKLWKMVYGNTDKQIIGQMFDNMTIRYGAKGRPGNSDIAIRVYGVATKKKGEGKAVKILYPEDAQITPNTKIHVIRVSKPITESEAKSLAENMYLKLSKRAITGTLSIPFANNFVEVEDAIEIIPSIEELNFVKGYYFRIDSISEKYDSRGYTQSIEFENDPLLKKSPKKRIPVTKK